MPSFSDEFFPNKPIFDKKAEVKKLNRSSHCIRVEDDKKNDEEIDNFLIFKFNPCRRAICGSTAAPICLPIDISLSIIHHFYLFYCSDSICCLLNLFQVRLSWTRFAQLVDFCFCPVRLSLRFHLKNSVPSPFQFHFALTMTSFRPPPPPVWLALL